MLSQLGRLVLGYGVLVLGDQLATISWTRRLQTDHQHWGDVATVSLSNETWRLRMQRNHGLLARSFQHVLHHGDGHTELAPGPEHCFYLGELENRSGDITASLSTCNGQLSGMLMKGRQIFLIDPVFGTSDQYWLRAVNKQISQLQHDVLRFLAPKPSQGRRTAGATTKYIEVLVVNDFARYTAFGGQDGLVQLATHTVAVMNAVTAIYRKAPSDGAVFPYTVQVVLVAQHTFVSSDPWPNVKMVGAEVAEGDLLEAFLTWTSAEMAAGKLPENDNRVLLSGRDFVDSTVGYAFLSSLCEVSRSGSINMCGATNNLMADCATTVAHELGHNFGMTHDSGSCPQTGYVMAATALNGEIVDQFSSCSVSDITKFFSQTYQKNGECLENKPSRVFGDPVCGNGFREDGEDCDCGSSDCSVIDPCCNGASCKFLDSSYHCSDSVSSCCSACRNVTVEAAKVCRAARSSCDLPEICPGGTSECPKDEYFYPGDACTISDGGKIFSGLCAMGSCHSMEYTCAVDITRDFSGTWDLSARCASFNDDCQTVVCHDATSASATECGQDFSVHGIHMPIPDGTPCWHPSEPNVQRTGMCFQGQCRRPESLAVVAFCGNGGIDYGEECDCGKTSDPCCDCSTCTLKANSACSSADACCDATTCSIKSAGTVCRAAASDCDIAEVCSGSSAICPSDVGKSWGTSCTASDGTPSTCYGKVCLPSLDAQCKDKTSGSKGVAKRNVSTGLAREFDEHSCTSPWCCTSCEQLDGEYSFNGLRVMNPVMCSECSWSQESSTFTVNGVSKKIYLAALVDGTLLADAKICIDAEATTPASSCSDSEFLEQSVGQCIPCDGACAGCYGPSALDCACCRFGDRDSRGACPISLDGIQEGQTACTFRTTQASDSGSLSGSSDTVGFVNYGKSWSFNAALLLLIYG